MPALNGPSRLPVTSKANSAVIMLHGRGSDGNDMIGLVNYFQNNLPNTAFFAPHAPHSFEDSPVGFQWYSSSTPELRIQGVIDVASSVDMYIDQVVSSLDIKTSNVALLGFSQGCITALHVGPRRADPLAGIVGLSGAITTSSDLGQQAKNSTPILLVHGEDDQVLPARLSVEASETLMELGIPVDLHIIPDLRHSIDSRVISIVTDFLLKVFS